MKKLALFIALVVSVGAFAQIEKVIPAKPNPPRLVNDFAGALTPEQREALEAKLVAYDDSTSNQIAVVTLGTTGDYVIDEVALGILRTWGVGGAKNNGIVILAAINDRKVWIATGYGLEGAVPDITAKAITDNDITPNFRAENYYRGFDAATNSIMKAAAGEYKAPARDRRGASGRGGGFGKIILGIIILFVILGMFGGGNNRGGGYMSRRGSSWLGPMILGNMLDRGSGGSGGGFGGGGFGGGGFGGFGGGSGGGGAGGSW
ncbi:MAG TPA: TPM domain-containing protein [Flavisolibacter sp.]|jgi:uncharacterized protein|nr:TPM domain-containing protein [Flavisolibacter sp.]